MYISVSSVLLPAIIGLVKFSNLSKILKTLGIFLFIVIPIEGTATYLALNNMNNLTLLHGYTIIEFTFLSAMFYQSFDHKSLRKSTLALIVAFSAFAIVNAFFIQGIDQLNSYSRGTECVLIILMSLAYFYEIFKGMKILRLEQHPMFWVTTGALLYFSGNLLLFLFYRSDMWAIIHSVLNIILNVCFAIAILKDAKKRNESWNQPHGIQP